MYLFTCKLSKEEIHYRPIDQFIIIAQVTCMLIYVFQFSVKRQLGLFQKPENTVQSTRVVTRRLGPNGLPRYNEILLY